MTREIIATGASANDGTGDTLRQAGNKINNNFEELWLFLGGDSTSLSPQLSLDSSGIIFEGSSTDDFETRLIVTNPTADRTVVIPNATGQVIMDSATQTLTNKTINSSTINDPVIDGMLINDADSSHQYALVAGGITKDINIKLPNLLDSDTFVFRSHGQTLSNKTLFKPIIQQEIRDSSDVTILALKRSAGATAHISLSNTDSAPFIRANGSGTNINLRLKTKGKGSTLLKPAYEPAEQNSQGPIDSDAGFVYFTQTANMEAYLGSGTTIGESKILLNRTAQGTNPTVTVKPYSSTQTQAYRKGSGTGGSIVLQRGGSAHFIWDGVYWNVIGYGMDSSTSTELVTLN